MKKMLDNGKLSLFGRNVEQCIEFIPFFELIFADFQPKRILELGCGCAGLTTYIALWAYLCDATYLTNDNRNREATQKHIDKISKILPLTFLEEDMYKVLPQLKDFISTDSPVMIICDGGIKLKQMETVTHWLNSGDLLLSHDYERPLSQGGLDEKTGIEFRNKYGYKPLFEDYWVEAHWICLKKI